MTGEVPERPPIPVGWFAKNVGDAFDSAAEQGDAWLGQGANRRIGMRQLKQWLHRMGSGLRAGIDLRKLLETEARNGPLAYRTVFAEFHRRISQGDSFADAARDAGNFFPAMVVEMIHVGEFTGKLDEVLLRLADHYDHMLTLRRTFFMGIAWPVVQLVIAIFVVGFLIWAVGVLMNPQSGVEPPDYFGIGTGTKGLMNYIAIVLTLIVSLGGIVLAIYRGWLGSAGWSLAMKIPLLGKCIETTALARLTWTLSMTLESGADARQSMRMALRSAQLPLFSDVANRVDDSILKGVEFHSALRDVNVFSDEFLHALEAAEISGQLSESMDRLSRDYTERATTSSRLLTGVATGLVYGGVAALLIYLIVRVFMSYVKMLESFL